MLPKNKKYNNINSTHTQTHIKTKMYPHVYKTESKYLRSIISDHTHIHTLKHKQIYKNWVKIFTKHHTLWPIHMLKNCIKIFAKYHIFTPMSFLFAFSLLWLVFILQPHPFPPPPKQQHPHKDPHLTTINTVSGQTMCAHILHKPSVLVHFTIPWTKSSRMFAHSWWTQSFKSCNSRAVNAAVYLIQLAKIIWVEFEEAERISLW